MCLSYNPSTFQELSHFTTESPYYYYLKMIKSLVCVCEVSNRSSYLLLILSYRMLLLTLSV